MNSRGLRPLRTKACLVFSVTLSLGVALPIAEAQQPIGAVALADLVQGLGVNTRVLVIGAHPDDEDTYLINWLSRGRHVETAYLSLTRGEGGQNLIGNELGFALGMIRTEELLNARAIDGGHQYFTRAVDFGFSKTYAEADSLWPHEKVLKDVVTIIRAFRPHVIVSVWMGTEADGHGHHQFSGVLAKEAWEQAGPGGRFSSAMTSGLFPWATPKFYRTIRPTPGASSMTIAPQTGPGNVTFNVGEYNPIFGRSYAELAAMGRSQHLSQGQGMLLPRGTRWDVVHLDTSRLARTDSVEQSIFDGIDTTWARFAGLSLPRSNVDDLAGAKARVALDSLPAAIHDAQAMFDATAPGRMVPAIGRVLRLAQSARSNLACPEVNVPQCGFGLADLAGALNTTIDRASRALLIAAGVTVEATSEREQVAVHDSANITVTIDNRGHSSVMIAGGSVTIEKNITQLGVRDVPVLPDSTLRIGGQVEMGAVSYPWWLVHGTDDKIKTIYDFRDGTQGIVDEMILGEDRVSSSKADLELVIDGNRVHVVTAPIMYRYADPARGEQRHPLAGMPKITTLFESLVEYIRANKPVERNVRVVVHSSSNAPDTVNVSLHLPIGLRADSAARRVVLAPYGTASVFFRLKGNVKPGSMLIAAYVADRAAVYRQGFIEIDYDHIRPIRFYQPPELYLSAVDVEIPAKLEVAYVRGVGDDVEPKLEQLGIKAQRISPDALSILDLTAYNALVIGPRAYEAIEAVASNTAAIQNFARRGGTVVVQHTTVADKPGVLPYPVTLASPADRVTDEKAEVVFLDSTSRLLNYPNKITVKDFKDWGQERALYMPRTFDAHYKALFSMHDKGEPANLGGVLVTPLGKGMFVYTTMSFFRQLPGGHPGAARLFVNLLSAGMRPVVVP